jgi:cytoskeletal protein CcmA (bactofilin family)
MMIWSKRRRAAPTRSDLTAFFDEGSEIDGKYTFSGTVMINGKFRGEIHTADTLIIGEKGVINANVRAGSLIVSGELVGNVVASERVELRSGARVLGDIDAPSVVVEEGVIFEGHCRMTSASPAGLKPADSTVVALKR